MGKALTKAEGNRVAQAISLVSDVLDPVAMYDELGDFSDDELCEFGHDARRITGMGFIAMVIATGKMHDRVSEKFDSDPKSKNFKPRERISFIGQKVQVAMELSPSEMSRHIRVYEGIVKPRIETEREKAGKRQIDGVTLFPIRSRGIYEIACDVAREAKVPPLDALAVVEDDKVGNGFGLKVAEKLMRKALKLPETGPKRGRPSGETEAPEPTIDDYASQLLDALQFFEKRKSGDPTLNKKTFVYLAERFHEEVTESLERMREYITSALEWLDGVEPIEEDEEEEEPKPETVKVKGGKTMRVVEVQRSLPVPSKRKAAAPRVDRSVSQEAAGDDGEDFAQ